MSATPMYDKPKEIIHLLNLLLKNDNRQTIKEIDIFDQDGNIKEGADEKLLFISKGYVSYLRGENPSTFPMRIIPKEAKIPKVKYNILGGEIPVNERLKYDKLILCEMKGLQYETYHKYIEKRLQNRNQKKKDRNNNDNIEEKKVSNILGDTIIQISNIIFPTDFVFII